MEDSNLTKIDADGVDAWFAARRASRPWYERAWDSVTHLLKRVWSYIRYDIHQGFYGLWYWSKFAWNWRPWDWAYGLDALKLHFVKLEECLRVHGHAVGSKKSAAEVRQALFLINRIQNDEYWSRGVPGAECLSEDASNKVRFAAHRRDFKYLMHFIGKRGMGWWD